MKTNLFILVSLILLSFPFFSQERNARSIHDSLSGFDARYYIALNLLEAKQEANYKALLSDHSNKNMSM